MIKLLIGLLALLAICFAGGRLAKTTARPYRERSTASRSREI
jgi:hypothetical protein